MWRSKRQHPGFTLIELMIVVTILAVLAALLIPALGRAQNRAQAIRCLGTAKAIATSVRTYIGTWRGWSHPDPNYFIKLMGKPLKNDTGYSANVARSVTDYRCPADSSPKLNMHGYYSSYNFLLPGQNLMAAASSSTPMVMEVGNRHPSQDGKVLSCSLVYTDLSASIAADRTGAGSIDPAIANGMGYFAWYTSNPTVLYPYVQTADLDTSKSAFQSATLKRNGIMASGTLQYNWQSWAWIAGSWPDAGAKQVATNGGYEMPMNCVIRWQGYWKFPSDSGATPPNPKTSQVRIYGDWGGYPSMWFWIDLNGNNKVDSGEGNTAGGNFDFYPTLEANKKYKVVVAWNNTNYNYCHVRMIWYYNRTGDINNWKALDFSQCWVNPSENYVP
jgi:prepilin-type N-terminal cleavage/methylation domain-containing protein